MQLAQVGEVATLLPEWIKEGVARGGDLIQVPSLTQQEQEKPKVIAQGYEQSRTRVCGELSWEERVLVVRSPAYADRERHMLEDRLTKAQTALLALTPAVGPGKRQIRAEENLISAAESILSKYRVTGLYANDEGVMLQFVLFRWVVLPNSTLRRGCSSVRTYMAYRYA